MFLVAPFGNLPRLLRNVSACYKVTYRKNCPQTFSTERDENSDPLKLVKAYMGL